MSFSTTDVQSIYDKAYAHPGLMGTHLDGEYSQTTKTTLLDMCIAAPNPRLLDMGTGDGDLWQFASPALEWHAIDISEVGTKRAQSRFSRLKAVVAITEALPYQNSFFGSIIAADTIEHVFDIGATLREVKRVLAPKGIFALSVPAPNSLRTWAFNRFLRQRPSPLLFGRLLWVVAKRQLLFGRAAFQPIDRDLTCAEWCAELESNGFTVTQAVEWPKPPFSPIVYLLGAEPMKGH